MILPREKGDLLIRRSVTPQTDLPLKVKDRTWHTRLLAVQAFYSLLATVEKFKKLVNYQLFIYLCNLPSAFLCAMQFCTVSVKEVNGTAYRN